MLEMLLKKGDRATIGSKAFGLHLCRLLEVSVPDFYVIPTDYYRDYISNGKTIENELISDIQDAFSKLGGIVVVRSSSVVEDLHNSSNAGQFKTVLNVKTELKLLAAIKKVWDSAEGHDMAVIIQKQLSPEISGVLFTRNPINGNDTRVIEYVHGLGDSLVSGKKNPFKLEIKNDLIQTNNAGNKHKSFEKLIELSNRLEIGFGYPLDIEWAKSDSEYYILQCRPITNLNPPDRIKGRTYSRVQAEQFFSGPVSPLFYSIFKKLYTTNYLQETISELKINLELDDDTLTRHKNYLYVDTKFYEYVLTHLPVKVNRERLFEVFPDDIRTELMLRNPIAKLKDVIKLLKFIAFNPKYWVSKLDIYFNDEVVPKLLSKLDTLKDFKQMNRLELLNSLQKLIDVSVLHIRTSKWGLGLYSIPLVEAMGHFLEKNKINKRNLSILISGLNVNKTFDASMELKELAEFIQVECCKATIRLFEIDHDDYPSYRRDLEKTLDGERIVDYFEVILKKFGHRRLSRDLLNPCWSEEPMIPFSILRRLVISTCGHTKITNTISNKISIKNRLSIEQEIRKKIPIRKRWIFGLLSKYMIRYIAFRELQRFYLDMILSKLRCLILEISSRMLKEGIINDSNDIFYLDFQDVNDYLLGVFLLNLAKKAEFNKISFEKNQITPGRYMRLGVDFDSISSSKCLAQVNHNGIREIMKGQPISNGCFSGKVQVIENVNDEVEIERNDIVITKCLDPGQTHIFLLAGALVIEVGGLLSHGTILAREFNLPTVGSIKNATKIFKNGQNITVNGTRGEIIIDQDLGVIK